MRPHARRDLVAVEARFLAEPGEDPFGRTSRSVENDPRPQRTVVAVEDLLELDGAVVTEAAQEVAPGATFGRVRQPPVKTLPLPMVILPLPPQWVCASSCR